MYGNRPSQSHRIKFLSSWRHALFGAAITAGTMASAQVVFNETFTDGISQAGFTVAQTTGTCTWLFNNPEPRPITGAGFDVDFAIFDSDHCGSGADSAAADLLSPVFNASGTGNFILSFSQQFRDIVGQVASVDVWNGSVWTTVYTPTGADEGYPNPAMTESVNITPATGGNSAAQIRFHYAGQWRWWWALDNIALQKMTCAPPAGLAVTAITTSGGTIGWTDNGSAGYEWAVTTGAVPNGTNAVASGTGSNHTIAGLNSGTPYTAWVRANCGDGTFSSWSNGVHFTTGITNDECGGAIHLMVNTNQNCANTTPGTVSGATASGLPSSCFGTADDDVWFMFTATDTLHRISLKNITGSTSDMYMALWAGTCGSLNLVPGSCSDPETMDIGGLSVGTTYYLQVYTWTSVPGQNSAFDVCVGTEPFCQPPANITLDSINSPNASVSWANNGAMEYQYELRVSGLPGSGSGGLLGEGTVTGSPLALTGLLPDSTYFIFIRSICSVGDTSEWSAGLEMFDGYCNTYNVSADVEPICNVTFADLNHDSPSTVNGTPALENFTDFFAHVARGGSYPISVTGNTNGDYPNFITAFFDWNGDQVFESHLDLGSFSNTECTVPATATVDVPADAALGTTHMRIVKNYNSYPTDPCGTYSFGQAEDYSVEVGSTGVPETHLANILSVHPNPASTDLYFNSMTGLPVQVQVFDMVGHLALEKTITNHLDVSNLAPGSYSLQITGLDGSHSAHARFMKQ